MVYACPDSEGVLLLYDMYANFTALQEEPTWGSFAGCVPAADKRAIHLPVCTERQARCRSRFYRHRRIYNPDGAAVQVLSGSNASNSTELVCADEIGYHAEPVAL